MHVILLLFAAIVSGRGARLFYPSFLTESEINHVREVRAPNGGPACNEDKLMNFLAQIQVINPETIVNVANLDDVAAACTKVSNNLKQIKGYLGTCTPSSQPDLYYQLIKGVESLHTKLCTDTPFKKNYEKVHKCLYELRNEFEDCEGPADWNENSDDKEVCKAYKNIADCYYIKTAKVCGKNAASTVKELLQAIINSVLTIKCSEANSNPTVNDPMPESYIKKTTGKALRLSASFLIIIILSGVNASFILYRTVYIY